MYITAASTILHQPTFRNQGFSSGLSELERPSVILHPDYADFIPANSRRRMSDVLKMAIVCTADCLEQADLKQPGAIIVGTSMGCSAFTRKFLDKIISSKGGLLSPTSFIVSTHNTIAGQISLLLGNHDHNMTHTQNTLSFEQALIDGMLCINEGCSHVLVGAADEGENELFNMCARLETHDTHATCGASFFILSAEKSPDACIKLVDAGSFGLINDLSMTIPDFLNTHDWSVGDVDAVLYAYSNPKTLDELHTIFDRQRLFDFQKITGTYLTHSAFAMNYGVDLLLYRGHPFFDEKIRNILICNNLIPENLGLILLETNEIE